MNAGTVPGLADKLYIQIFADRMVVRSATSGRSVELPADPPYSHPRTLVGDFTNAQAIVKRAVKELQKGRLVLYTSAIVHPRERTEGGLTQIEERCFRELALGGGARKALVWTGHDLADPEIIAKV